MFPGPGARIYRNEDGEPIGWDYPSDDPPEPVDDDDDLDWDAYDGGPRSESWPVV